MKRAKNRPARGNSKKEIVDTNEDNRVSEFIPGIRDFKWAEILEQEEKDLIVLQIRDEILNNCLEICYQNYLDRQVIKFTAHCSYLAWKKIVNCYFLRHDPGEPFLSTNPPAWRPDTEPPTSAIDSWASHVLPIMQEPESTVTIESPFPSYASIEEGKEKSISEVTVPKEESIEEVKLVYLRTPSPSIEFPDGFTKESFDESLALNRPSRAEGLASRGVSIFTRTFLAPKSELPNWKTDSLMRPNLRQKLSQRFDISTVVVPPEILSPVDMPPERVEVAYSIVQQDVPPRGSSPSETAVRKKTPTIAWEEGTKD